MIVNIRNITSTASIERKEEHLSHHIASFDNDLIDLPQHSDDRPLLTHFSTLCNLKIYGCVTWSNIT